MLEDLIICLKNRKKTDKQISICLFPSDQFLPDIITAVFFAVKSGFQKVWEEQETKDDEDNKKLDHDNDPKFFSNRHGRESFVKEEK
jgi:hypothetical protein